MRVINLTHGEGNGIDKACLMTASNMLIGRGQDGDYNSCVCPVIRAFILLTNDRMPEPLLRELYGPLAWEILGTRNDDRDVILERCYAVVNWVLFEILPLVGITVECEQVTDGRTAADAAYKAADAAYKAANAYKAAYKSAKAAANAYKAAADANAYNAANAAAAYAAYKSANAANAAAAYAAYKSANAAAVWRKCPDIIRRMAAIGDKRPVECVLTEDQLCEALL